MDCLIAVNRLGHIANLIERVVEVRRDPREGVGYASEHVFRPGELISPLAAPTVRISVADLLP